MKFDVVVGNPPYQEEIVGTSDRQIYYLFMDLGYALSDISVFVTPARFLFNAGKTPQKWNEKMLADEHLKVVYYEQDSSNVFSNTDIKGGVAITVHDNQQVFGAINMFTVFPELNSILKKVIHHEGFEDIMSIIHLQNKFNLEKLYEDYPEVEAIVGSNGREKRLTTPIFEQLFLFTDEKQSDGDVQILGLIKNKRTYKYINTKYLEAHVNLDKFKVLLPQSNGSGAIGEVLSTPLIGEPLIGFTQTFISFGGYDNIIEAENLLKYIKTKFTRVLLGVLKITQHNPKNTWQYVPLQDFTPDSDIDWTQSIPDIDQQLYKKYGLDDAEIAFIEEKVRAME